jgi:hypothetical protein
MDWEIYDGQMQRGPMPEAGVHDAIRNGLPRNAYVRQAGASEWLPIETHPIFGAALRERGPAGDWRSPPPPPPAYVGAVQPVVAVAAPPPGTAYAVARPSAGQPARRRLVGGGCLVQGLGIALLVGAGVAPYASLGLVVQGAAAALGLGLLLAGGLLNLKWVCGLCKAPIANRSVQMCPSCHASFT